MTSLKTQIAVIGAGHAGIEAAIASARLGLDTVLFTMSLDSIGNMPCNPSIGGTAKGHLVFEIDALGGVMGEIADKVTLQSRTLNLGKGAAVHSKRIQADRKKYQEEMKHVLEKQENLFIKQAEIVDFTVEDGKVKTIETNIEKLPEHSKNGELESSYLCLVECLEELEYLKNNTRLTFSNIF